MIVAIGNLVSTMSMLAFTSEVESGSSTLDFVGHFLTKVRTPYVVMQENALFTVDVFSVDSVQASTR